MAGHTCARYMRYFAFFIVTFSNFSSRTMAPGAIEMLLRRLGRLTLASAKCGAAPTRLPVLCLDRNLRPSSQPLTPIDAADTKHDVA